MSNPTLMDTRGCLCLAARRAARSITREFDRALRPHGLRSTQFSALSVLALAGPKPMTELAEILSADRTTLTRNLAVLERRGLLDIHRGQDARERITTVTDAGRVALEAALPDWRRIQAQVSISLGDDAAAGLRSVAWVAVAPGKSAKGAARPERKPTRRRTGAGEEPA